MQIRYNRRRKTFIYPWMKKATPQPEPPSQPVPEPDVQIVAKLEPVVKHESNPNPLPELDPTAEPSPKSVVIPMSELEPSLGSATNLVPEVDLALELVASSLSVPEDIRILHKYLDPFLHPEPVTSAF